MRTRKKIRSANEIFTENAIKETSKLLNISEDVVKTVLDTLILQIIDDASKQSNESDYVKLRVPGICDLDILVIRKAQSRIRVRDTYLEEDFKEMLKNAVFTDKDYLTDAIVNGVSELIVDKFTKAINKMEEEDKYG